MTESEGTQFHLHSWKDPPSCLPEAYHLSVIVLETTFPQPLICFHAYCVDAVALSLSDLSFSFFPVFLKYFLSNCGNLLKQVFIVK